MPGSTSGSAVTVAGTRRPKYSKLTASLTPTRAGSQAGAMGWCSMTAGMTSACALLQD
ncbi:hypothetical protein IWX75_001400 [Arthrobacter sp. CAN_A6]